jgi:hypothetical protein
MVHTTELNRVTVLAVFIFDGQYPRGTATVNCSIGFDNMQFLAGFQPIISMFVLTTIIM